MYSLLGNVVTSNGMLSYMGNFLGGWGIGVCVIAFTVSFEFEDYGGDYTLVQIINNIVGSQPHR